MNHTLVIALYKTFRKDLGIQLMINISKLNRMKNPNPTATTPFFRQIHWPFPAHPAIFQTLKFFALNDVKIRVLVGSKCHFIWTISQQKRGLVHSTDAKIIVSTSNFSRERKKNWICSFMLQHLFLPYIQSWNGCLMLDSGDVFFIK